MSLGSLQKEVAPGIGTFKENTMWEHSRKVPIRQPKRDTEEKPTSLHLELPGSRTMEDNLNC